MLANRMNRHIFHGGSICGVRYCTKIPVTHMCLLLRCAVGPNSFFLDKNVQFYRRIAVEEILDLEILNAWIGLQSSWTCIPWMTGNFVANF